MNQPRPTLQFLRPAYGILRQSLLKTQGLNRLLRHLKMKQQKTPTTLAGAAKKRPKAKAPASRKVKGSSKPSGEDGERSLTVEQQFLVALQQKVLSDDYRANLQSHVERRPVRESDKIDVGNFPNVGTVREWNVAIRKNIVAASGRPVEAMTWICEV